MKKNSYKLPIGTLITNYVKYCKISLQQVLKKNGFYPFIIKYSLKEKIVYTPICLTGLKTDRIKN